MRQSKFGGPRTRYRGPRNQAWKEPVRPIATGGAPAFKKGDLVKVRKEFPDLERLDNPHSRNWLRGEIIEVRRVQNEEMRRKGLSPEIVYDVRVSRDGETWVMERIKEYRVHAEDDILGALAEATETPDE